MRPRLLLFRIAAVIILLITGVELVTCEVVNPAACEIAGAQGSQTPDSGDACLCCCAHVVVNAPITFEPLEKTVALVTVAAVPLHSLESASIYHPPKV
jgi:hypothetical protein